MPGVTINGPVVPADTHNAVLRESLFHSNVVREESSASYHVIEIGVREGAYTSWVGTWDQSKQRVDAATPTSILDTGRHGMRLKAGQAIVVKVSSYGTPTSLSGARVNFTLALVGGRDGVAKPLVSAGAAVSDPNSRVAIAALERQINTGGLSAWDEPVQLQDPVGLVVTGTFHGRLQRDSATQISIQRYSGNWIEVDGNAVSIGSNGLVLTTGDGLLSAAGAVSGTTPSASTLYYVYVFTDGDVRLSATAPTYNNGVYYFGSSPAGATWRFVGWIRTNSSVEFVDDTTDRLVVNYFNRLWKTILLRPAYSDGDTSTTYTTTSTTWTAANAGTGATASYIANGEDGLHVTAFGILVNSNAGVTTRLGIGDNSGTTCVAATRMTGTTALACACSYSTVPATGYRTLVLLVSVSANTGTYTADDARNGSASDPAMTGLYATVPV